MKSNLREISQRYADAKGFEEMGEIFYEFALFLTNEESKNYCFYEQLFLKARKAGCTTVDGYIRLMCRNGISRVEIAKRLDMTYEGLFKHLERLGIEKIPGAGKKLKNGFNEITYNGLMKFKDKYQTDKPYIVLKKMYDGMSMKEISVKTGLNIQTISRHISRAGIKKKPCGRRAANV